jgi:repressor LexA
MLTSKQYEALKLIDGLTKKAGFGPSYDEIRRGLGLKSKSGVHRLIQGLLARGFLKQPKHLKHGAARALRVVDYPEGWGRELCSRCGGTGYKKGRKKGVH